MQLKVDILMIRRVRIARGWTVKALAKIAGISYTSAIRAVNQGLCGMKVANAISESLGVSLQDLIIGCNRED